MTHFAAGAGIGERQAVTHSATLMLDRLRRLWRALMRFFLREEDDKSEEGPIETAFQISCLILVLVVGLVVLMAWLSR